MGSKSERLADSMDRDFADDLGARAWRPDRDSARQDLRALGLDDFSVVAHRFLRNEHAFSFRSRRCLA